MDTIQIPKIDNSSPIYDELAAELGDPTAPDEDLDAAFAIYSEAKASLHDLVVQEYIKAVDEETAQRNEA